MAVSCRTFSLGHGLVSYTFDAAIRIVYGDPDGSNEDDRDDVRSAVKSSGYCAAKQLLSSNLSGEGAPAPTDARDSKLMKAH